MNQIVNKSSLAGDKLMPEMHLRQLDSLILLVNHLLKINKELQNLCKREVHIIFTGMSWIKLIFNMIWLMASTKT